MDIYIKVWLHLKVITLSERRWSQEDKTIVIQECLGGSVGLASDFSSGHDLAFHGFKPGIGLCADSLEPKACFRFCVSLSAPPHLISVSLCQK